MSINLIHGRKIFLPKVPNNIEDVAMQQYVSRLSDAIENMYTKLVDNDSVAIDTINTGTSGSFVDSDGNTITVTNGLITGLA